jgi:hypothetical protein
MVRILFTLIALLGWCSGCFAQQSARKELRGYAKLTFGMTEEEAKKVQAFSERAIERYGVRLTVAEPIVIDDKPYTLSARFVNGKIDSILLSSSTDRTFRGICFSQWTRAVALVQSRYGPPEVPLTDKGLEGSNIARDFIFADGNGISVTAWFIGDHCLVSVAYLAKKGSGSF